MSSSITLSPSVISAWLACEHSLALRVAGVAGKRDFGEFADLIMEKGLSHEEAVLGRYAEQGLRVRKAQEKDEMAFEDWAESSRPMFQDPEADVLYQVPLIHDDIKGVADFFIRVEPEDGYCEWEPVDAKLARSEAKPGHILQLCFYAEALEALTGRPPRYIHVELGSGKRESYRYDEFGPYWRRMRSNLNVLTRSGPMAETIAEPCTFCDFCEYQPQCEAEWRKSDSLVYVADLSKKDRRTVEAFGVTTLEDLAKDPLPSGVLPDGRSERVHLQAVLQRQARADEAGTPPYVVIEAGDLDPLWGHGFSLLPEPDEGDVFFDLEGHPFLTPEDGLFFLFGLWMKDRDQWKYQAFWAHNKEEEISAAAQVVALFDRRREQFPGMHVYHYNHTERSALDRMTAGHESSVIFTKLKDSGCFVDLHPVVKNSVQVGIESYGLKKLEGVTGFERHGEIEKGSGAVLKYEQFVESGDPQLLEDIALYNENDVHSTMVLRNWLVSLRPEVLRWRDAVVEHEASNPEREEIISQLLALGDSAPGHLLGDLLGYWKRETSAEITPKFEATRQPIADLIDDEDFLAGLENVSLTESENAKNEEKIDFEAEFRFPPQKLSEDWKPGVDLLMTGRDLESGFGKIKALNLDEGTVTISWSRHQDLNPLMPVSVVTQEWIGDAPKPEAMQLAAMRLLTAVDVLNPATEQLLTASSPRFHDGQGPKNGLFDDKIENICAWLGALDHSVVAIQGPPGTGKTYRGAHMVETLLEQGKRIGVMAPSHSAIDNFFEAVIKHLGSVNKLHLLKAGRKLGKNHSRRLDGVGYHSTNPPVARANKYNLLGGTSWFFCSKEMRENPVDYLFVDEAGQISLADTVAASLVAGNIILLGDPQQLEQVSKAAHPDGAGATPLEHILQGDATIAPERGVFIEETWRMHPDICKFVSSQMYDDRLTSEANCARQEVIGHGAGLRYIPAEHAGNSTVATEEAEIIVSKIKELIGSEWRDRDGNIHVLGQGDDDFMVVAPFNDQKNEIRRLLELDPTTAVFAKSVGTVDKFQGREAPVVFFSMTTSSEEEISRSTDFLFSKNRLNVAVSRARCLFYLVCTEALLGIKAQKVEDMRLVGTLNALVEVAERI